MKGIKQLFQIYVTFFKLGSMSFGGGYAVLPLMEREVIEEKKWISKEKIVDIFSVAQALPGAVALNSSAFVGYSIAGIKGAVSALLGNLTPSVIIMIILSILLDRFSSNTFVQAAFYGIRPVIVGLILYAAFKIGRTALKDLPCAVIAIACFILIMAFHIPVIVVILGGILVGILLYITKVIFKIPTDSIGREGR